MIKIFSILLIICVLISSNFSNSKFLKTSKAKYEINLVSETEGISKVIRCDADLHILDCAEEENMDLPYSSRVGADKKSIGKIISGIVDQSEQRALSEDEVEEGYVLLDVAYPRSNLVIEYDLQDY
jgi:ferredoxin